MKSIPSTRGNRHRFALLNYVVIPALLFSCSQAPVAKKDQHAEHSSKMSAPVIKTATAPKQVFLTDSNKPAIFKAGKPVVIVDSSMGGAAFFTNFGTEQGLAQMYISSICEDRMGNLWFGTGGGGVSRYDGKSFTTYSTAHGLAGNSVSCILQDASGNMWFGTQGTGVSRYDGKSFKTFTKADGLAANRILTMMLDASGNVWFSTPGRGASKFDGKKFTNYTTEQGLAQNYVQYITQDKEGNIWFATYSKGVSKFDGKTFTNYTTDQGLVSNVLWSIIQDHKGNMWFSTGKKGVSRFDGKTFTNFSVADGLVNDLVNRMLEDKDGKIWFATYGGVSKYDGKNFINYTTANGLTENHVTALTEDKAGNIWLGTDGGGVVRYDGSGFRKFTTSEGLASNIVWGSAQDSAGNTWFATQGAGASKYDGKSFTNFSKAQGLPGNDLWSMLPDKAGNIWMGTTNGGAIRYDGNTFAYYSLPQGLMGTGVMRMILDQSGDVWFATIGGGISRFDGKSFTNYNTAQGLVDSNVTSMIQTRSGEYWIATQGGGVSHFDGKTFTNYTTAQGLGSNSIFCLLEDQTGAIWFGTDGGGISRFDGKHFKNYTTAEGLPNDEVFSMVEDPKRGMVWAGTNLGISGLKTSSASSEDSAVKFEVFNQSTGYPVKDLNTNGLSIDRNGIIWMGCGDNKVVRFDYDAVKKDLQPLHLRVTKIKVNNEDIIWNHLIPPSKDTGAADSLVFLNEMVTAFGRVLPQSALDAMHKKYGDIQLDSVSRFYPVPVNLVLPYHHNNLTIDFVAVDPSKPKQVSYQYKLEGYSREWSPPTNNSSAEFGNIPEGNYTLKLKALSAFGVSSEIAYTFRVLPPWYRTWWAYTAYFLLVIGSVWALVQFRLKQLRREKRVLEQEVSLRTHQLEEEKDKVESALTELKSTQAQLIQSAKMASLGELTSGIAHEIQNPLNFVNNFSDLNQELLGEMTEELEKGNLDEVKAIADDLRDNEKKINGHGKRAEAIVKGMLQHSRPSTGVKEETNVNALVDETIRLAFNGLKSRDKTFTAEIKTDFDPAISTVSMIPQDIGRVLLNLFNNAFYAVAEKAKQQSAGYEPTVSISTKKSDSKIEVRVKDNGTGIPEKIIDKIFQPFFTTKPTGQGTGLGLSLSYDIVKAQGGEIIVSSEEGGYAEFVVVLPG